MHGKFLILLVIVLTFNRHSKACSYSPQPKCKALDYSGLSPTQKTLITNLHNQLRWTISSGLESRGNPGPQPAAKQSLPYLRWSNELANRAQLWANECIVGHDQQYCRDIQKYQVGQNVGEYPIYYGTSVDDAITSMVQYWYNEVIYYNGQDTNKPYIQMVWAGVTDIGCGAVMHHKQDYPFVHLVCNYGPSGNIRGGRMYIPRD